MKKILASFAIICTVNLVSQVRCCPKRVSTEAFAMLTHNKKIVTTHLAPSPYMLKKQTVKDISFKSPDGKGAIVRCCPKRVSTEAFAMLTHNKKFVTSHLIPLPFVLKNQIGKDISFKSPDGKDAYGYEIKAAKPTNNYVFVIHEWWGLNDQIKRESEKLFHTLGNVNVIAVDLFDKQVATNHDSATKYLGMLKTERAESIIKGALAYVGPKANIVTIGWCSGGGWSLQASLLAGKQAKACIVYYGQPEENITKLKSLKAPVFFVWAEQDQWINKEVVNKFEENMKLAKKSLQVKSYNADHAFANPSNPKFNRDFTEDAYMKATDFAKNHLK